MKLNSLLNQKYAVAGVIEALLLVALVAVVISTIQVIYIPEIMKQREAEHMDEVENQFSYLKSVIDIQSTMQEDIPVSSSITLGSRELPYFVTARAFGQLDINDYTNSWICFDSFPPDGDCYPLTSIQLDSMNSYYIDKDFILEGGGLIIKQSDGEAMRVAPSISWELQGGTINIDWTLPEFYSIAGKNSTAGFKNCYIRTNYSSNDMINFNNPNFVDIHTDYITAWYNSLNLIFDEAIENDDITIRKFPIDSPDRVRMEGAEDVEISIDMTIIQFGAQIGPGTVLQ